MYNNDRTRMMGAPLRTEYRAPEMAVRSMDGSNVNIYSPTTFDDVQTLINFLKRHDQVIVDLNAIIKDAVAATRILDFLSGAIYALDASMKEIGQNLFLLAPRGVTITVPPQFRR